jgi:anti-sigma B factor antagonist
MIRASPGRSVWVGDIGHLIKIVNDVPVVTPPSEIDRTNAYQVRLAVLQAAAQGHATIVVDMSQTRFCDSSGMTVLIHAHQRALAEGGELRLVIPADGAVLRIFTLTGLDRVIPCFGSLDEALLRRPAAVIIPLRPRRHPRRPPRPGWNRGQDGGA